MTANKPMPAAEKVAENRVYPSTAKSILFVSLVFTGRFLNVSSDQNDHANLIVFRCTFDTPDALNLTEALFFLSQSTGREHLRSVNLWEKTLPLLHNRNAAWWGRSMCLESA